ncbi:hypothetical protein GLYMA_09G054400v4 [Glycine max]|uniref:Uncharacterized protein n=1 Tax=Glycine max TaxID=3847 RepID=K7LBX7_SOYBN|nr:putative UPF0481 protein At3g02645 [Glycine max]KAH1041615.1 hypothetical protein GYH30_024123 [Glycine max]KRH37252.1 hypothetical protein GLYMA_09G054400v4 [Glycine max]|eukprot:XP_006586976.1 putative UPF0481 protein At3g02645 [Glycine max]
MACEKLIKFAYHRFSTRKFNGTTNRMSSNWRNRMKKELESGKIAKQEESQHHQSHPVCIYRVPSNMRQVEPKAYRPNNISIGPCHYGAPQLKNMEDLKKKFYRRLFHPMNDENGTKLDEAFKFLEENENKVRGCYMEDIKLSSDEFLQMMLVDSSFAVQLLRNLSACEFGHIPCLSSKWMLPMIRREMIMLENQLPIFVLSKLFDLTSTDPSSQPCTSLKTLALRFFYPLLQVDPENYPECDKAEELTELHFLDLLRSSIRPKLEGQKPRRSQHHMIRSVTELVEAGVKIKADGSKQLLDITFGKKYSCLIRELTIPPLYINDHRGTVFRNIVAFENCHKGCEPDVTTYLFFFNGLINSADDVSLLHYKGVLNHSLGNDNTVSELINNITKEIVLSKSESYLYKVVNEANSYYGSCYARIRASIVHHYLTSWVVGVSTFFAVLVLCLTIMQTVCGFADALKDLENKRFLSLLYDAVCFPVRGIPTTVHKRSESGIPTPVHKRSENSTSQDAATKFESCYFYIYLSEFSFSS